MTRAIQLLPHLTESALSSLKPQKIGKIGKIGKIDFRKEATLEAEDWS